MNIALWAVAIVLALVFLAAGLMKIAQPREKLATSGMAWAGDFSAGAVKTIGTAEVLGALGLTLPGALDIAPALVAWAALGLALVMAGATVLLALAAVVAVGRFGSYAF